MYLSGSCISYFAETSRNDNDFRLACLVITQKYWQDITFKLLWKAFNAGVLNFSIRIESIIPQHLQSPFSNVATVTA